MEDIYKIQAFIWESQTANNCNTYIIDGPMKILIDPGHLQMFGHVEDGLNQMGLTVNDIDLVLCTHAHPDHIESVQLFKQQTKALFAIHEKEWQWIVSMDKYIQSMFGTTIDAFRPDFLLKEGDLNVKGINLMVIHTPGHSPGSICLYLPEDNVLFTGDLVFKQGVGRTDLPGGNGKLLKQSIQRLCGIQQLDWLFSGHGEVISGNEEIQSNFKEIEQFWLRFMT
ncbi:MAG: MBL fold metallo-hydrolase [Desulfobacterales bacterium]|nr:MBL fold metallo-hydrolase [Desulfobacterales bacterium]